MRTKLPRLALTESPRQPLQRSDVRASRLFCRFCRRRSPLCLVALPRVVLLAVEATNAKKTAPVPEGEEEDALPMPVDDEPMFVVKDYSRQPRKVFWEGGQRPG